MTYRYLLFDADDTLFDFDQSSRRAFHIAMTENGVTEQDGDYERYAAINLALWKQFERGEIEKQEILTKRFRRYAEAYGIACAPDAVNESYKLALCSQNILMPSALDVIKTLHQKGFRLFIITNGDANIQHRRLAGSPITPYIEKVFISEEIGYQKPSREFFDAVMTGIEGFEKEKALVIGDSETSDIKGANNAGIDACYFSPMGAALPVGITARYRISALTDLYAILND
ncbi:MAG: YjjG family noncanonical pyrimidine nucleotidase [Clostridia bacterium]|nr:YjjG family noncanonical pyrimidine nucleotidase [Clostridia bacterium]